MLHLTDSEVEITICKSEMTNIGSAEVGVQIKHIDTNIVVKATHNRSQHLNKLAALELLKEELVKLRFKNINEDDLVDGKSFRKELNSGKYD